MGINQAGSGYRPNLTASARDGRSINAMSSTGSASNTAQSSVAVSPSSQNPATIVTLSDRAKAIMARAEQDQKIADKLGEVVAAANGKAKGQSSQFSKAGADILSKYGDLPGAKQWAANASADNLSILTAGMNGFDLNRMENDVRTLQAGGLVRLGQEGMNEDEQFVQSIQMQLATKVVDLEKAGQSDQAQALRNAINGGTVKVQKSDDVPDLNLKYSTTHFADGSSGGTSSSWDWNPTGAAKTALDSGHAMAVGGSDRGAFFMSW